MKYPYSKRRESLIEKMHRYSAGSSRKAPIARPSRYIWHLLELLKEMPTIPIVLVIRVSTKQQTEDDNHLDAELEALKLLDECGASAFRCFHEEGKATIPVEDRPVFMAAIELARQIGGVVLTVSVDRLIRPFEFDRSNDSNKLTDNRLRELIRAGRGVPFATILHPDTLNVRGIQTKRGQRAKGGLIGRPPKQTRGPGWAVRRKQALLIEAKNLREHGLSLRQIAKALNRGDWPPVGYSTVRNWLRS